MPAALPGQGDLAETTISRADVPASAVPTPVLTVKAPKKKR
jgi:hypothetical protein